jgi:hypothetical protein
MVMGQGVVTVALVIVPVHMVKEAAHVCVQGIIDDEKRLSAALV